MSQKIVPIIIAVLVLIGVVGYSLHQKYLTAATVNGKQVSRLEVIAELEKQGGKKVLDTVITQKLILEEAKKKNVSASKDEINAELKKIETGLSAQGQSLDDVLTQRGMSKADLLKDVELQVLVQKLVKADTIKISDADVEKYMKDNKAQFPENAKDKPDSKQIKDMLRQQKLQAKIQEFITSLRSNAKISYFGAYK